MFCWKQKCCDFSFVTIQLEQTLKQRIELSQKADIRFQRIPSHTGIQWIQNVKAD